VLARGEVELDAPRAELTLENLMFHMAGGAGLNLLEHELHRGPTQDQEVRGSQLITPIPASAESRAPKFDFGRRE
jgi:hypothetical protein